MARTREILENGASLEVRTNEANHLIGAGLIYWCPECNAYHIPHDHTWADVEDALMEFHATHDGSVEYGEIVDGK